jgi:tRNA-Thr(GGU) m(6)t(6)A37 methyltransferase TsaA
VMKRLVLIPIGHVRNEVTDLRFSEWKRLVSRLVIHEEYVEALEGIEEFSHLFVVTRLHLPGRVLLRRHPRDRKDLPVVGIFATRSQLRPNRLGLHLVRLLGREGNELSVRGLDVANGTPLVDIKPYVPDLDMAKDTALPEWVTRLGEFPGNRKQGQQSAGRKEGQDETM